MNRQVAGVPVRRGSSRSGTFRMKSPSTLLRAVAELLERRIFLSNNTGSFSQSQAASDWYDTSWGYRKAITVDHTKIAGSSDLVDYPLVVSITDPTLANRGVNGKDILFTSADGVTKLAHEIETYNASTGTLVAWVKIPDLSPADDTVLYMYYGNPAAPDQQDVHGVWDESYAGVWHMPSGASFQVDDSTSNANDGSRGGAATEGKIGRAGFYDGRTEYVDIANRPSLQPGPNLSFSCWMNLPSFGTPGWHGIMAKRDNIQADYGINYNPDPDINVFQAYFNTSSDDYRGLQLISVPFGSNFNPGEWAYITGTIEQADDGTAQFTLYKDGRELSRTTATTGVVPTTSRLSFGRSGGAIGEYARVKLDEVRISNVARSPEWIATEYDNQNDPGSFYSVGSEDKASQAFMSSLNISGLAISPAFSSGALITWITDGLANSQVGLATTAGGPYEFTSVTDSPLFVSSHSVRITGLAPDTTYYVVAQSEDAEHTISTSAEISFTTAPRDTTPPVISSITVSLSSVSAAVRWTTDEPADSRVWYATVSGGPYSTTPLFDAVDPVLNHSVPVLRLTAGSTYYYLIQTSDQDGNTAACAEGSFTIPHSRALASSSLGVPFRYNTQYPAKWVYGDTWGTTVGANGNIYAVSDDTNGWNGNLIPGRNFAVSRLEGNPVTSGATVNSMDEYTGASPLGPDGASWKADGIGSFDGALYVFVSRHSYGPGFNTPYDATHYFQPIANASIIKSSNYGVTWVNHLGQTATPPPIDSGSMFPGRSFAAPYFVQYGPDGATSGADNSNAYVYAVSPDNFDFNSNHMCLGRVRRSDLPRLRGSDWQFYRGNGGDGMIDSNWTYDVADTTPILSSPHSFSMTGVQYDQPLRRYIMPQWNWPDGNIFSSVWNLYQAPAPWGPWTQFSTYSWPGDAFYSPLIVPNSIDSTGLHMEILTAGNFSTQALSPIDTKYTIYSFPLDLSAVQDPLGPVRRTPSKPLTRAAQTIAQLFLTLPESR